jgi:hypothetical protein
MFGIILTVTLAAALPSGLSPGGLAVAATASVEDAGTTCDPTAPRCDLTADDPGKADVDSAGWPIGFATPAMIDCRLPAAAPLLQAMVGECDGTTRDTSYRASRDPESERSSGSLHPARRERTHAGTLSACAGVPSEGGDATVSASSNQPLALFALPDLPRQSASRFLDDAALLPRSRQLRPLERPPRA